MKNPTKKIISCRDKATGPSLPVILQQPQSHSLGLAHYNQTNLHRPSFKRRRQIKNCKQASIFFAECNKNSWVIGCLLEQ